MAQKEVLRERISSLVKSKPSRKIVDDLRSESNASSHESRACGVLEVKSLIQPQACPSISPSKDSDANRKKESIAKESNKYVEDRDEKKDGIESPKHNSFLGDSSGLLGSSAASQLEADSADSNSVSESGGEEDKNQQASLFRKVSSSKAD